MGRYSRAMYQKAIEEFADSVENLVCEHFQRGSDSLGEDGWDNLAHTFYMLAHAMTAAGEKLAEFPEKATEWPRKPTFKEWVRQKGSDYPMRRLVQHDAWVNASPHDDVLPADADGDAMCWGPTCEPQRTETTVRVYAAADANRKDVVRLLRKIAARVEKEPTEASQTDERGVPF